MLAVSLSLMAPASFFQSSLHAKQPIYLGFMKDHLAIIARSFLGFCHKYLLISYHNIPIRFNWNNNHSVKNKQVLFFLCRHDMPRKKTTQSSETDCATGTSVAGGCVLRSHLKQAALPFIIISGGKKTPMLTSISTPSKARVQQLLTHISPEVLHSALRSFKQQTLTTTLLVMNQNSPVVALSRISTLEQGTVKLDPSFTFRDCTRRRAWKETSSTTQ